MRKAFSLPTLADPDSGLKETLSVLRRGEVLSRRRILRGLGGVALLASPVGAWASCALIPSETGGPYPGDGTNGQNVLTQSGIVRSDIRASFGSAGTTVAAGAQLTVTLQLVNVDANCAPLAGYAVYLWHCNASGQYSMYSSGVTTQNYLRGVQISDSSGKVTFTTIFPGCYSGRWPHIHFEIYPSAAQAVTGSNAVRTSQLALPASTCREVYAQTALYPGSVTNLNQVSLSSDNVFGNDSGVLQVASVAGSIAGGYSATLDVGLGAGAAASVPDLDQHGLTGNWYNPATDGQGLSLEIHPDLTVPGQGALFGGWFTYAVAPAGGADKLRWYSLWGPVYTGNATATLQLLENVGGNFDAPPVTTDHGIGSATFKVLSCNAAELAYVFDDGRSGTIALQRLLPNVTCSTTTARPTSTDFALSGNWFSPSTSGQGFVFELNPTSPYLFCTWYTYAPNGQAIGGAASQRWYTAETAYTPGARNFSLALYEMAGGIFASATQPTETAVGTATLTFHSCARATFTYDFTAGTNAGRTGSIDLIRVGPAPASCVA
jgi:protocatechuate 3,4-dioxygenase beta subunit